MKDLVHFAHGNGFPSGCYEQLLKGLEPRYNYCYIDKIGHNPLFPVTENWHLLVDELLMSVETQAQEPVIALGHSLGGILSLLAAIEKPSLFKAVILLDSPIISRFKSGIIYLAKFLGLIDKVTPALRARGRKNHWQNKEAILTYLKKKPLFKDFTDACLEDYISYGVEKNKQGLTLRFDREIESAIYRTIPHSLPFYEGKLTVPTALIYGNKSTVVSEFDVRYMKKYYNISSYKVPGTHMFPMEHPKRATEEIFKALDALKLADKRIILKGENGVV